VLDRLTAYTLQVLVLSCSIAHNSQSPCVYLPPIAHTLQVPVFDYHDASEYLAQYQKK